MKKTIGNIGEEISCRYLQDKGYKIINKNYRTKFGEIDIIAMNEKIIAFIEVKTRKSKIFGMPRESVNYHKQQVYKKLALYYIQNNNYYKDADYRFDVIEVLLTHDEEYNINHIVNAF